MHLHDQQADQLDALLADFTVRLRAGEEPSVDDYARRHPELSEAIRELFPTVQTVEQLKRCRHAPVDESLTNTPDNGRREDTHDANATAGFGPGQSALDLAGLFHPAQTPDEIGRLGSYRILRLLGRGGMGAVFVAEDLRLRRTVALKVMLPDVARQSDARDRFLREARLAAAIEHDNIVTIYQVDEDRGMPFIAMPLLKGMSLDDRIRSNVPLTVPEIVQIGCEVAQGLAAAHEHDLIHRDVKPANIWLESKGQSAAAGGSKVTHSALPSAVGKQPTGSSRVKILDFGLARPTTGDANITHSGVVVGTPAYMAPEQARGETIDGRADLFSLGVVLYRLTTGELPFRGKDALSTLMALATVHPPAPRQLKPDIPKKLSELVLKLLAKDAAQRPSSAAAVADALAEIQPAVQRGTHAGSGSPEPARAQRGRRRSLAVAAVLLLLALLPLGYFFGGTVVRFATNQGELIIDLDDPNIEVRIVREQAILFDKTRNREFTISAGKGSVDVWEKDGAKFTTTKPFELTRGGRTVVKVSFAEAKATPTSPVITARGDGALAFDGKSSYISIPTLRLDVLDTVTLEAWVQPVVSKSARAIIVLGGKARCQLNVNKFGLYACDHRLDSVEIPLGPRPLQGFESKGLVHLAYVADAGEGRLYLDGVAVAREPRTADALLRQDVNPVDHSWLGGHPVGGNNDIIGFFFEGMVGETRVSKRARYTKNFTPTRRFEPDKDTLALYHFDEGKGDVLKDSSGNGHHGQIVNAKWTSAAGSASIAPALAKAPFDVSEAKQHQDAWAKHLGVKVEDVNSIGMKLRLIPPAQFTMGAIDDATAKDHESPSHLVTIGRPFYVGMHEVTVGQFREFVQAKNYLTEAERGNGGSNRHAPPDGDFIFDASATWKKPGFAQTEQHPVVHVSWNDARAFCDWLSEKEKKTYRLLTEAEWEYCCRAGTTTRFSWGDNDDDAKDHANFADAAYKKSFATTKHPTLPGNDDCDFTAPVGRFRPNAFGLFDMHGNVWEWVQDKFDAEYYSKSPPPADPLGPGVGKTHVLRGGSWVTMPWYGRVSFRDGGSIPTARYDHIGFRVLLESSAQMHAWFR